MAPMKAMKDVVIPPADPAEDPGEAQTKAADAAEAQDNQPRARG